MGYSVSHDQGEAIIKVLEEAKDVMNEYEKLAKKYHAMRIAVLVTLRRAHTHADCKQVEASNLKHIIAPLEDLE